MIFNNSEYLVNTGFSTIQQPSLPLDSHAPLKPDSYYLFWFEVGKLIPGSIEISPTDLPLDKMPPEVELQVALFSCNNEIAIKSADRGDIGILPYRIIEVIRPAYIPESLADSELLHYRLFFMIYTSLKEGEQRFYCHIYYQQNLIQSRLITAQVRHSLESIPDALKSEVDFTLSKNLNNKHLHTFQKSHLSLAINTFDATHTFQFFGESTFQHESKLGEGEVKHLITMARGALSQAAWGKETAYDKFKDTYLYEIPARNINFATDLIRFAVRGYEFYSALIGTLAGDINLAVNQLRQLMLKPGQIQIASKKSVKLVLPVAMIYDYPLDVGYLLSDYKLCDVFLEALENDTPLETTPCFQGKCPHYEDDMVVCPSGFWGYRHRIGLPMSVGKKSNMLEELAVTSLKLAVSVSTDPDFTYRSQHEQNLQGMIVEWEYADSREEAFNLLRRTKAPVVYFYCHGGVSSIGRPYLKVGSNTDGDIVPSNLLNKGIRWRDPQPLVFINGCHTTDLSPEKALDFVTAFVETANAAGVIGTEITIFEPIAVAFAEECLQQFLVEGQTIGEAVRKARLKMLQNYNPLGLVYIPYVSPGLRIVKKFSQIAEEVETV